MQYRRGVISHHTSGQCNERTSEVTSECVFTRDQNGNFSQRIIDALFRLATMDWIQISTVMHRTTYLQPNRESATFLLPMVWQQQTVPWGGVVDQAMRHCCAPTWHKLFSQVLSVSASLFTNSLNPTFENLGPIHRG